ncbi:MAG TPA: tetratricopeptide repeat protein [Polyangiaceae bacterium]|nr:tetratricopeptide repeat protein [Polyangiaceae bacterium]
MPKLASKVIASGTASLPPEPPATLGSVAAPSAASFLFAQANQSRERGVYDAALRSYAKLIDTSPQEPEANAARVMLGRLLLDRGEPQAAPTQFEAYLRSGANTLGEEAQLGCALALRKVGRVADEIQAWQALLAAYPDSVHAARAQERLSELGVQ